jgi:serine/threonine protein kinase
MFKLISAVHHIHSKNIIHRDLKMENILLTDNRNEVKIIDFGLSKILSIDGNDKLSFVGTPIYTSPEVFNHDLYDFKTDMWSLGVIMYVMLSGAYPFCGENNHQTISDNIVEGNYNFNAPRWENMSINSIDLIKKLLQVDSKIRLNTE